MTFGGGRERHACRRARAAPGLLGLLATRCARSLPRDGGGPTSLGEALGRVGAARAPAGLVIVVSDFRGPRDWRAAAARSCAAATT